MYPFVVLIFMLGVVDVHAASVTCRDEDGVPVDMFIIYKLPRIASYPGNNYVYLDSNNLQFRVGRHQISSKLSPPGRTLEQVYAQYNDVTNEKTGSQTLAHIFYNDGVPGAHKYDFNFGHTKGELAFDKESGFWIISSVPNFPTRVSKGYAYPDSGYKYGQMLMCVSFPSTTFRDIGLQLKYTKPHIYDSNLPIAWKTEYRAIYDVIMGNHVDSPPFSNVVNLKSRMKTNYIHFGKTSKFGHDLYHNLVAPSLKTNLFAETWQHGSHNLGPSCKGEYTVVDIRTVSIRTSNSTYLFRIFDDHSKYAIGELISAPYVCVGDINRQYTQYRRGGGCICVKNIDLWKQFKSLVHTSDSCNKKEKEINDEYT